MLLARTFGELRSCGAPRRRRKSSSSAAATAARRRRAICACGADGTIDVTLVERDAAFVSCPLSNLVIGGSRQLADITIAYDGLAKLGVRRIARRGDRHRCRGAKRQVWPSGEQLPYDRLILAPGVDFVYDAIPGLISPAAQARVPHAWKAGPQTVALRAQPRGDARRRRVRDPRAEGAVSMSPGPVRARVPGRALFPAAQAEIKGDHSRRQRGRAVEKGVVHRRVGGSVQRLCRLPSEQRAGRRRHGDFDDQARFRRCSRRCDQRDSAAARRRDRAPAGHGQCQRPLLPGRFPHLRVDGAEGHSRARRCDPGRAADAQVRPHGQSARQRSAQRRSSRCCRAAKSIRRR